MFMWAHLPKTLRMLRMVICFSKNLKTLKVIQGERTDGWTKGNTITPSATTLRWGTKIIPHVCRYCMNCSGSFTCSRRFILPIIMKYFFRIRQFMYLQDTCISSGYDKNQERVPPWDWLLEQNTVLVYIKCHFQIYIWIQWQVYHVGSLQ